MARRREAKAHSQGTIARHLRQAADLPEIYYLVALKGFLTFAL
jgi:hypothetical protein